MNTALEPIRVVQRSLPNIAGPGSRIFNVCPICGHVVRKKAWIYRHFRIKHGATS